MADYPARLHVDYSEKLCRVSTFFRGIITIPVGIISGPLIWGIGALNNYSLSAPVFIMIAVLFGIIMPFIPSAGRGGIPAWFPYLYLAYVPMYLILSPLVMMLLFRKKYPRFWFDWAAGVTQFIYRVWAFQFLLSDKYPSTDEEQYMHITIDYPDAGKDLSRGLPLIKWIMAIPHYIVLGFLGTAAWIVSIIAWFAILFTGSYPRGLFDFVAGYLRWSLRVWTYVLLLATDKYPPFSLD